jgi:Ca-activated chloride channel family protein
VVGAVVATVAAAVSAWSADSADFHADSKLVLVPVTVLDRRGATVNGLAKGAFMVTENGVRQTVGSFSEEDAPVSIGVVLDLSGSMRAVLGPAKDSLRALLSDANPADEVFLNTVSTRPAVTSGFTRDFGEVLNRVVFESAGGSTALFDTAWNSVKELRSGVHPRKALLVISDGMDNNSRHLAPSRSSRWRSGAGSSSSTNSPGRPAGLASWFVAGQILKGPPPSLAAPFAAST